MALLKRKRAGLNDAMSVVTRFVNACNRHDADGVASCLHPDFDSIQPMYPSRNFRGADQVRRNWQAIFDAEPGFRLTVLRSAPVDDTVWLELHGAGRDAEVAGVFIMGIQGDRVRWARIYSALVEPVPAGVEDPTAASTTLHEVRSPDEPRTAGNGEVVEEALIAPVVDIERPGRRRRRSARDSEEAVTEAPAAEDAIAVAASEPEVTAEPEETAEVEVAAEPEPEVMVAAKPEMPPEEVDEPQVVSEVVGDEPVPEVVAETLAEPEVDAVVVAEVTQEPQAPEPDPMVLVWPSTDTESQPQPEVVPEPTPAPESASEPEEPAVASHVPAPAGSPPPKWRFGRRGR